MDRKKSTRKDNLKIQVTSKNVDGIWNDNESSDEEIEYYYRRSQGTNDKKATSSFTLDANEIEGSRTGIYRNMKQCPSTYKKAYSGPLKYIYHYGNYEIHEEELSRMSNVVIRDRVIDTPVYTEPPKQYRNVGVQMTTQYVVPKVKLSEKKVRNVNTQTIKVETPPHIISTPPMTPSPPPAIIIPPSPTPPPIDKPLPIVPRPRKPEPPTMKIIQVPQPQRALFYRVGGGWERVKVKCKPKHRPVTVMDASTGTLQGKHSLVQTGSRAMKEYFQRLVYDKCRGRPQSVPNYILQELYNG